MFRRTLLMILAASSCLAQAQPYPDRPIRVVSPYTPGGGTDYLARLLASKLTEATKWTLVVDNKPGANGTVGLLDVAHSHPAGYDVVIGQKDNMIISPLLTPVKLDPVKSFAPIGMIGTTPILFVVNAHSPYKTFADVIKAAKAKPDSLTFGSSGSGSVSHITSELLRKQADVKLVHVPYKGSTPALTDLLGEHVDLVGASIASAMPFLRSGKMRALAVSSARRSPALPDVPTVAEFGFPDFDVTGWWGLLGPAGTPPDVVNKLNAALNQCLAREEVRGLMREQGIAPEGSTPAAFGRFVQADFAKWKQVIAVTGVKVD